MTSHRLVDKLQHLVRVTRADRCENGKNNALHVRTPTLMTQSFDAIAGLRSMNWRIAATS